MWTALELCTTIALIDKSTFSLLTLLFVTQVLFVAFDKAWILGAVLCKLLLYGQIVTLASSTFILTSMSLDRYFAICHPLGSFTVSRSRAKVMIAVSWLLAFVFATPQLAIFTQVDSHIKYFDWNNLN